MNSTTCTSTNSPLTVNFVAPRSLALPGRLGLTIAPGKRDPGRRWRRDLATDLQRLRAEYRASLLVSLMELHEYEFLKIPTLLDDARALGIECAWFPIVDVAAPHVGQLRAFDQLIRGILDELRRGGTVVVHCRGGIGRSGTVAACCLAALGHSPSEAINIVRSARHPRAVETDQQAAWVALYAAHVSRTNLADGLRDKARACLLGGALGDALGHPIEFLSAGKITERFGAEPPSSLCYAGGPLGLITDDTQMTLFSAEALIRAKPARQRGPATSARDELRRAYLRWLTTQGFSCERADLGERSGLIDEPRLCVQRAPGNTCLGALRTLAANPSTEHSAEVPANNSKGCGAVMRVAPVGLAAATREQAFELGLEAGALTHGHPSGYLSAAYLAALVWDLARGQTLPFAMDQADGLLAHNRGADELRTILDRVRALAGIERGAARTPKATPPTIESLERLGGGWVGEEALAIALVCVHTREGDDPPSIQRALWRAVRHGGDSDSTGAITGNLLGAMLGNACLPADWLAELELVELIADVADRLSDTD